VSTEPWELHGAEEGVAALGQYAPSELVPESRRMLPDTPRASMRRAGVIWKWTTAGLMLVAIAVGAWRIAVRLQPSIPPSPREPTLTQLTANPLDLPVTSARISPDGRYLAYADPTGIQVRLIDRGETQRIPDTRGLSVDTWSDDGTKILAWACAATTCTGWDVSLVGGRRRHSGAVWASTDFTLPTPDGSRLLRWTPPNGNELWVDFVNGSPPRLLVRLAGKEDSIRCASWSGDANRVLFTRTETPAVIESVPLTGGPSLPVFKAEGGQQISETGVELRDGRLLTVVRSAEHDAVAVVEVVTDVKTGIARSSSRRLTEWRPRAHIEQLSASLDGRRVAFVEGTAHEEVYVARFDAHAARLVDTPRRITMDERGTSPSDWTPDGRAVLFDSPRNGSWDIFEQDLTTESVEALVADPGDQVMARVTGDGQWVLFTELSSDRGYGPVRVMGVPISGGVPHEVFASATWAFPRCSAHGRCVVFEQRGDQMIISSLDPGSRQRR